MKTVHWFPHRARGVENCWIPMSDGCLLTARMWLPADAERSPVPAIVECLLYGKRDRTRWCDEPMQHDFAGHGYACLRIDLRRSGEPMPQVSLRRRPADPEGMYP